MSRRSMEKEEVFVHIDRLQKGGCSNVVVVCVEPRFGVVTELKKQQGLLCVCVRVKRSVLLLRRASDNS